MLAKIKQPVIKLIFLSAIIEIFFIACLQAQDYPFREYSSLDGLPQSQANMIFQDRRGYIWIPTRNGLSRFDGIEFVNYTRKEGLISNEVQGVFEDSLGIIWARSEKSGLSTYDGIGFRSYPLENILDKNPVSGKNGSNVIYFLGNRPGKINFRIFKFSNGTYTDFSSHLKSLDTLSIFDACMSGKNDAFIVFDKYGNVWALKDSLFTLVSKMKFDDMYTEDGNVVLKKGSEAYEYINGKLELRPQMNYLGKVSAEYNYLIPGKELTVSDGRSINRIELPFTPVRTFIDREGILWFPSERNVQRLVSTAFSSFREIKIGIGNIWTILESNDGHLWFGSLYGDLVEYDGKNFKKRNEYKLIFDNQTAFYKGSIRLSGGELWFSTNKGVLIWNGKKFSKLKSLPPGTQVCIIYEDPEEKKIMIGTDRGLFILKNNTITCRKELNDNDLGDVEGITRDSEGKYWLSGHKGLVVMDGDKLTYLKDEQFPHINSFTLVTDMYGGIWVTSEEGLFFKGKSSDKFTMAVPESPIRPANSIILMDSTHLIAGRVSDICVIDLEKYYRNRSDGIRIYDKTDGFEGDDCLDNGIIRDKNGNFWILTSDMVVKFNPGRLQVNKLPPILHLTGIFYKNDSLQWKPVIKQGFYYGLPQQISFCLRWKSLKITFTGISTTNPEKVTYRYRLSGFNEEWSQPVRERSVTYEKLPPGKFIFELTAANADGIQTPEPLRLAFRNVPVFWQTPLFLIIMIVMVIGINILGTWYLFKSRQARIAKEQKLKLEVMRIQVKSILKQFDAHFTFNVISSIGSLIMKEDRKAAYEYIAKFSGMLRSVLNADGYATIPLSKELDFVRNYLELQKLRFKERLSYSVTVHENVDDNLEIPKLGIQLFVENSIKHGIEHKIEGGRVDVEVLKNDSNLNLMIRDNGIGRAAAMKIQTGGTGQSIRIISAIIEKMNKANKNKACIDIIDLEKEGIPSGTEVRIIIPDNYDYNNFFVELNEK